MFQVFRVSLQERTIIPPQSIKFASVLVDRSFTGSLCIDTNKDMLNGIVPPNSISSQCQSKIQFQNYTDQFVTLK